ncbi:hypothetical protein A2V68_00480 [candidate division Kazan bacterium RBG_13_50_9]|uniref:Endolytic murein transglycosylase n=1 Tax=candidate division Kazan bacterium RBG_13_50_9 TaxID=1798535 RepID=A0A1F4NS15_UNCK3|nr:MAG: hypothetical protein A2V68_00480 [candidate division Kazan bacterium RBG_13_50_9]
MKLKLWAVLATIGGAIAAAVLIFYFLALAPVGAGEVRNFTVQSGETISSIAKHLEEEHLIRSPWGFKFYLKLTGKIIVQPGIYQLSPAYGTARVANVIASGDTANITVTIPEGYTLEQIAELLASKGVTSKEEFIKEASDFPPDYDFSKYRPLGHSLEGFLFPDTYRLIKGDALAAVRVMLDNFGVKFRNDIKDELGDRDLHPILIVASMVEREAKTQTDREQIAAVLWNRLDAGMRLDVDATVRYITGNWEDPIAREDLASDSPYNTRRFAGLPPGPICNPGLASIKAALNPPTSSYYYYLTDFEGITHYAETLDEHNQNKLKYLL